MPEIIYGFFMGTLWKGKAVWYCLCGIIGYIWLLWALGCPELKPVLVRRK